MYSFIQVQLGHHQQLLEKLRKAMKLSLHNHNRGAKSGSRLLWHRKFCLNYLDYEG
jgi:hypothetical protein